MQRFQMHFLINLSLFETWNDFYKPPIDSLEQPTISHTTFNLLTHNMPYSPKESCVWIFSCYFQNISSSGYGASVNYQPENGHILIEQSNFAYCHSNIGTLYFLNTDFVISKVCAVHCSATSSSFCYVATRRIFDSTIAHCSSTEVTMSLYNGYVSIESMNSTYNLITDYGASAILSSSNQVDINNNLGTLYKYCSFFQNTATQSSSYCIILSNSQVNTFNYHIQYSNIISNTAQVIIQ